MIIMLEWLRQLNRRIDKNLPAFGLIIIDEAHISNFNKLPFYDEDIKIVGVSTTPTSSNEIKLSEKYKDLIIPTSIKHLIENNYLVPPIHTHLRKSVKKQDLRSHNWDYDIKQMSTIL